MMLTQAADKLGIEITVVDKTPDCPAAQAGAKQIVADLHDRQALKELADATDIITIEIEHVDTEFLAELNKLGKPIYPDPKVIKTIQDKFTQKKHFSELGLPVAKYGLVEDITSAEKLLDNFGGQMIMKRRLGGFDGRGNMVVNSKQDIEQAFEALGVNDLYAEKMVNFKKELAIMAGRDISGNVSIYPVVETVQARNICQEVYAPAAVDQALSHSIEQIAKTILGSYQTAGMFGIELFLDHDNQILINEVAPRVHNSGHYTIEGCQTSQFEQHLRCITGQPLGDTKLTRNAVVMVNILGENNGTVDKQITVTEHPTDTYTHFYGKAETKIDRKMGHITSLADDFETALKAARDARGKIKV